MTERAGLASVLILAVVVAFAGLAAMPVAGPPNEHNSGGRAGAASGQPTVSPTMVVTGSQELEHDRVCIQGAVTVTAHYSASSPAGPIVEMRTTRREHTRGRDSVCSELVQEVPTAAWRPFVTQESFPAAVSTHSLGFAQAVQFRDGAGNHSPVLCGGVRDPGGLCYPTPTPTRATPTPTRTRPPRATDTPSVTPEPSNTAPSSATPTPTYSAYVPVAARG